MQNLVTNEVWHDAGQIESRKLFLFEILSSRFKIDRHEECYSGVENFNYCKKPSKGFILM